MNGHNKNRATARRWILSGSVQGVGFRPFVYRLAVRHALSGWVRNCQGEVELVAEGLPEELDLFGEALISKAPAIAQPRLVFKEELESRGYNGFEIAASWSSGKAAIQLPPDYFTCSDCLHELEDPGNRRYRYPFINCTQCGPRYTLIRALPYDRTNTAMAGFALCAACRQEYTDPGDRRFHAEPVACPECGPQVTLMDEGGSTEGEQALKRAIRLLKDGKVLAVKGVGGYHLMCDAGSDEAVMALRSRKSRPHKPLAVMFSGPAGSPFEQVREVVQLSEVEESLLGGTRRPIVLCRKQKNNRLTDWHLSELIAPGLGEIGVMLPYSPLHHLLLSEFSRPLVATSGNISGEPVITDSETASRRLAHVADAFLHHNRPIERPADDSVYRVIGSEPMPIRLGRGMAPLELVLPVTLERPVLATGGHLKNSVALAWENRMVISPHIGDMGTLRSQVVFEKIIDDLQQIYAVRAEQILCDAHPGYATHRWAKKSSHLPVVEIWHHHAHASALALESPLERCLVFTWDAVGLGPDHTLWGGEALLGGPGAWRRFSSFRPFRLPGGDRAGREPWRSAAALCWGLGLEFARPDTDMGLLRMAWNKGLNAPVTSAAGRLFDAAAALVGLCERASFEGQGPMWLEALCEQTGEALDLPLEEEREGTWRVDWSPVVQRLRDNTLTAGARAECFHETMAQAALKQARLARESHSIDTIGLAGGVFQNRILTERVMALMEREGFRCVTGRMLPVNDGGLSAGQVMEFGCRLRKGNLQPVT